MSVHCHKLVQQTNKLSFSLAGMPDLPTRGHECKWERSGRASAHLGLLHLAGDLDLWLADTLISHQVAGDQGDRDILTVSVSIDYYVLSGWVPS